MPRRESLLFAEHPELSRSVPWLGIADGPTPVEPCSAIEAWLGRGDVWVKRDDRVSEAFGGNKVRRYEYLLADAKQRGARTLVTVGGLASTQIVATSILGREHGFGVTAVVFDQPLTSFCRRAMAASAGAGARLVYGGGYATTAWRTVRALREAERPYLIFPGASNPMANLGYVDAMLELGEQVRAGEAPRPDVIVVPTGSSGTLVGLSIGVALLGWPTTVIGVRITDLFACNRFTVGTLAALTTRYLVRRAPGVKVGPLRWQLFHDVIGGGYGHPTPEAIEAAPRVTELTGAPAEITYTGKAMAALRAIARARPKDTILYWATLSSRWPDAPAQALPPELERGLEGQAGI